MTHPMQATASDRITELLAGHGLDGPARAVTVLPNAVMTIERAAALGAAPDQRTEHRTGYANGFEPETIHTRLGASTVDVPRARGVEFDPAAPEKGVRSERALKPAVAEMDVRGVSTREVAAVTEQLCGLEVTGARVSRAAEALDAAPEEWRTRPLGETPYLILDARYENVRHGGAVGSCAVPVAIGIGPQGKRSVPGTSASPSVAGVHGREFPAGLQARGLHGVEMVVSDATPGRGRR